MADIRVFEQADMDLGKVAINLDQVVKIERSEATGDRRDSPTRDLLAVFVMTTGTNRIQVLIKSVSAEEAANGELDGAFEEFIKNLAAPSAGRRSGAH